MPKKTLLLTIILVLAILFVACEPTPTPPTATSTSVATRSPNPTQTSTVTVSPSETPPPGPAPTIVGSELFEVYPTLMADSLSKEQIAEYLLALWLEQFKSDSVDLRVRLIDYKLGTAEIRPEYQRCAKEHEALFIASVTYSVEPAGQPSTWDAGSGESSEDFKWVLNKSVDMAVIQNGNTYTWKSLGFPVCPPS